LICLDLDFLENPHFAFWNGELREATVGISRSLGKKNTTVLLRPYALENECKLPFKFRLIEFAAGFTHIGRLTEIGPSSRPYKEKTLTATV
jgi:hypothetical protein